MVAQCFFGNEDTFVVSHVSTLDMAVWKTINWDLNDKREAHT